MTMQAHDRAGGTVVELEGAFGPTDADRLHDLLVGIGPETPVTIDFRAVRLCHDTAVARLARELEDSNRRVALLGLSEHHRRLLRYIGFASSQPGTA